MRGKGHKSQQEIFMLGIRKNIFTMSLTPFIVQQIAQRGCEGSCFLFYYSSELKEPVSASHLWPGAGGGAPVCGMIIPGSGTEVAVAQIM